MGGTGTFERDGAGTLHRRDNAGRLSGWVAMLPFFEEQALWTQINAPVQVDGVTFPAMGPAPTVSNYDPWKTQLTTLRCSSDPTKATEFGLTNYAFCIGDAGRDLYVEKKSESGKLLPPRGVFAAASQRATRFSDILDGRSNTIAMIEIANKMDQSVIGQFAVEQPDRLLDAPKSGNELIDPNHSTSYLDAIPLSKSGRGGRWADGAAGVSLTNTIMPPNRISFAVDGDDAVDGVYAGSSYHQGGVHVLMADGAVKFVTDSIESGDLASPAPSAWYATDTSRASPYGLWGALGTAASEDMAELENDY